MDVLVVNAGSATLKLALVAPDDSLRGARELAAPGGRADAAAVRAAVSDLLERVEGTPHRDGDGRGPAVAVGHRIVHGGTEFVTPVLVDDRVAERLARLTALAPLHQPAALEALARAREVLPDAPQVACFDTSFHATLPPAAATYALPADWRERYGLRRYGFHGLSHAYASRRAAALAGAAGAPARRIVTCHLGSGASLAAVLDGVSVDTTMGFTPLAGLVMSTRSGDVDPGLLLWLQTQAGLGAAEIEDALFHASGMLALAGTADLRLIVQRAGAGAAGLGVAAGPGVAGSAVGGDPAAVLALAVYLHRLRAGIAAMAAAMGGLDVLVLTGGVGERSAQIRAGAADGLGFLGVALDLARNAAHAPSDGDADLTADGAAVRAYVLAAREDLEIAHAVRSVLTGG